MVEIIGEDDVHRRSKIEYFSSRDSFWVTGSNNYVALHYPLCYPLSFSLFVFSVSSHLQGTKLIICLSGNATIWETTIIVVRDNYSYN